MLNLKSHQREKVALFAKILLFHSIALGKRFDRPPFSIRMRTVNNPKRKCVIYSKIYIFGLWPERERESLRNSCSFETEKKTQRIERVEWESDWIKCTPCRADEEHSRNSLATRPSERQRFAFLLYFCKKKGLILCYGKEYMWFLRAFTSIIHSATIRLIFGVISQCMLL